MAKKGAKSGRAGTKEPVRVLLVDDNLHDRELVRHALETGGEGFVVDMVSSYEELKGLKDPGTYDILLTDFNILGFTGLDVIDEIRRVAPKIPVILVTGTGSEKVAVEALRRGISDYVIKTDVHIRQLPHRILSVLERSRLEDEYRKASESFERIVMDSPDAMLVSGKDGRILFANPAAQELFGRPVEGVASAELGLADRGDETFELEITKKKRTSTGLVSSAPVTWHEAEGTLFTVRNITELKAAQAKAQNLYNMLTHYLETSPTLTYAMKVVSGRFDIVWVSPNVENLTGFTVEEALEPGWWESNVHPDDLDRTIAAFAPILKEGRATREYRFLTKSGQTLWVKEMTRVSRYDEKGRVEEIVGTTTDITDLKMTEEALRRSQRELALRNEIASALLLTDSAEEMCKSMLEVILKATESEVGILGHVDEKENWMCTFPDEEVWKRCRVEGKEARFPKDAWGGIWGRAMKERRAVCCEGPFKIPDGHIEITRAISVPIIHGKKLVGNIVVANAPRPYSNEEVGLLRAVAVQIAPILHARIEKELERKKSEELEKQLEQSQRLESIGRLAGGVAHDFNNMLNVIIGYGEILLDELKEDDPMAEDIRQMVEAARRSADLTRQLLAFSRKQTLQPVVLNINDLIEDLEKMLRRLIGEDIELTLALDKKTGHILADPSQIEQVIMNLAVNARDAMPQGGSLIIETSEVLLDDEYSATHAGVTPGRYVMLAVTDTGCGMAKEVAEHIFEPFFTTKEKGKGTGLGLSTVYGIVKQSGGNIWVYSEPGEGTTFKVYLPATDEKPEDRADMPQESAPTGRKEHIMVVEDEDSLRRLMEKVLAQHDYDVTSAANGGEAVLLVEEKGIRPDLLITDVVMPNMSGKQLADRLRESIADLKVLYMSGYTDNAIVHHGVLDRGVPFMQKPFNLQDFVKKVRELLDGK